MKFDQLNYFLRWVMRINNPDYLYQPITIKTLFENNGSVKKEIISKSILKIMNTKKHIRNDHYVYSVLKKYKILSDHDKYVELLDFDKYNDEQKRIIINTCNYRIEHKNISDNVKQLCDEFNYWYKTTNKTNYHDYIENNKNRIIKIMHYIDLGDDNYIFRNLILNNNQLTLNSEEYTQNLYSMIKNFLHDKNIQLLQKSYIDNNIHELEPNSYSDISTILFYLDSRCPMINRKLNRVYEHFSELFDMGDTISDNMKNYNEDHQKWNKLYRNFQEYGIHDIRHFQIFCYWYSTIMSERPIHFLLSWKELEFPEFHHPDEKYAPLHPFPTAKSFLPSHVTYSNAYTKFFEQKFPLTENEITPKNGLVIFLDGLGTKNISDHETRLKRWGELVGNWKCYFPESGMGPSLHMRTKFTNFSDTIMITIDEKNQDDFAMFLNAVGESLAQFIFHAMKFDIFFRGCISYGKYMENDYAGIGEAVNDAAESHNIANWVGISVAPLLYKKIHKELRDDDSEDPFFNKLTSFIEYNIPLKSGTELGYVLDLHALWGKFYTKRKGLYEILYNKLCNMNKHSASLKYRNTLMYIMTRQNNISLKPSKYMSFS